MDAVPIPTSWLRLYLLCVFVHFVSSQPPLSVDDVYTFCGRGRAKGDNSVCLGFCESRQTICSSETGVCSCSSPVNKLSTIGNNYNCKPAKPRTRCHNACKTYTMLTPQFRRGEVRVCDNKLNSKRMCFCLPKS